MGTKRFCSLALVLFSCGLGACGGGGSNAAPEVAFDNLLAPIMAMIGGTVAIDYTDDDTDSDAMTSFYADIDGDLLTTGDQVVIATDRPEMDGTAQSFFWDTAGVTPGIYRIFAVTTDGSTVVVVEATGRVTVNDVATFGPSDGTVLRGTAFNVRVTFLFPLVNPTLTLATMPVRVAAIVTPGTYTVENLREVVFVPASCVFPAPAPVMVDVMTTMGVTGAVAAIVRTASFATAVSPVWVIGRFETLLSEADAVGEVETADFVLDPDDDPWFVVCSRGGTLYISSRGGNTSVDGYIIVFNTLTGTVTDRIALTESDTDPAIFTIPAGLALSADEMTLYAAVFETDDYQSVGGDGYLVTIDLATGTETNRIPLGQPGDGRLRNLVLSPSGLRAYVAGYDAGVIHVVNLVTMTEVDTDGDTLNGITPFATTEGTPAGLELNATGSWLYVAHGGSGATPDVTTIDTATFTEGAPLVTTANASRSSPNLALNPCDGLLYVPHVQYDTTDEEGLTVFDPAVPTATVVVTSSGNSNDDNRGIAFVWGTTLVVTGNGDDGDIYVIDRTDLAAGSTTFATSLGGVSGVATIPPMRY